MKSVKAIVVFIIIMISIGWATGIARYANIACIEIQGYGMDVKGNLYIGKQWGIEVYNEESELLRTIDLDMNIYSRYTFEVKEDVILVSDGKTAKTLDLYGNELESEIDNYKEAFNEYKKTRLEFTSPTGETYIVNEKEGREYVTTNADGKNRIIYEMPMLDYVFRQIAKIEKADKFFLEAGLIIWFLIELHFTNGNIILYMFKHKYEIPVFKLFKKENKKENINEISKEIFPVDRIKPYIIEGWGYSFNVLIMCTFSIIIKYIFGFSDLILTVLIVSSLLWVVVPLVKRDYLVISDNNRKLYKVEDVKVIDVKPYINRINSQYESFIVFYPDQSLSRYILTVKRESEVKNEKMVVYLKKPEEERLLELMNDDGNFKIEYLKKSKAVKEIVII